MYDIVIVGAGPAGLTAAIYARRAEKSVLVLEKECVGGQITHSPRVENYPGYPVISGAELGDKLFEHALSLGAELELDAVKEIVGTAGSLTVKGEYGEYEAKSVIVATGSHHRTLGLPGEERFTGEGISYCAVCDGAFYKGKTVAVIGGGNSALQDAVLLSESCEKVYVVQNLPFLTGESALASILAGRNNVEVILSATVKEIVEEDGNFAGILIEKADTGATEALGVDGMFVAIGQVPQCEPFAGTLALSDYGYIEAGEDCKPVSVLDGIFVAGDCRTKAIRQVATAVSDGATAALAACRFVDGL